MTNISHKNKQQRPASSCEKGAAVGKNQTHHHVWAVQCTAHIKKIKNGCRQLIKYRIQLDGVRLERLSALYHTSTTAPTSHSHRFPNQGMEANFFCWFGLMHASSNIIHPRLLTPQLTDISDPPDFRLTWFYWCQIYGSMAHYHKYKYSVSSRAGYISHLCQKIIFFRALVALFWSNRKAQETVELSFACSLHQTLGTPLQTSFCRILQLFKFVDPLSRLECVWQKHCNGHRPNTTGNRCDRSSNLGGLLVTDVSDEPITPGAFWVLPQSESVNHQ